MVILKPIKKQMSKFIGAYFPQWIYSYFVLYALAKGVSKSELTRNIVEEWCNRQKMTNPEETLVQEITQKVKMQYKVDCTDRSKRPPLVTYKANVKAELRGRGLTAVNIETILNEIE